MTNNTKVFRNSRSDHNAVKPDPRFSVGCIRKNGRNHPREATEVVNGFQFVKWKQNYVGCIRTYVVKKPNYV